MPTDLPNEAIFSVEHDFSAVEAHTRAVEVGAKARLMLSAGVALLAAGAGVGLGAYGLSFAIEPKIIETTKVVTETKIERVEIPKIVTETRVERVEVPRIVERQGPTPVVQQPAPLAAPQVGEQSTAERFSQSEAYQLAEFHGRIQRFNRGRLVFEDGRFFQMADRTGKFVGRPTTTRFNGDLAYCRHTRNFPDGKEVWPCNVLHNGVVVSISSARDDRATGRSVTRRNNDGGPFPDLFE